MQTPPPPTPDQLIAGLKSQIAALKAALDKALAENVEMRIMEIIPAPASPPASCSRFVDLPIIFRDSETKEGGWSRTVEREGTVAELLDIWDIEDENETSEMAQVLRHLRNYFPENVNVDLPDTAAQDSASKSNSPAVSG